MKNNVVLRQIRYIFDLNDSQMINIFAQADVTVTRELVSDWLKKEEDEDYEILSDFELATFLNGFINERRGKKEGVQRPAEKRLNNNLIFRKLKIALAYKDTDIIDIYKLADVSVSKHEISAFFRNPNQKQYRDCKDQLLRNFLYGLKLKYRQEEEGK